MHSGFFIANKKTSINLLLFTTYCIGCPFNIINIIYQIIEYIFNVRIGIHFITSNLY